MTAPEHCQACGHPGRDDDPIVHVRDEDTVTWPDGWWICESHTHNLRSGFYGAEVAS